MSIKQIRVGDVGIPITLTVYEDGAVKDISSASALTMQIRKPSGELLTKDATFTTDGVNGQITYTSEDDVFDEEGYYEIRANFTLNTFEGTSSALIVNAEAIE